MHMRGEGISYKKESEERLLRKQSKARVKHYLVGLLSVYYV